RNRAPRTQPTRRLNSSLMGYAALNPSLRDETYTRFAMKDEHVLERKPLVLDQRSRERYFEDGFLVVPGYVGAAWLDRLRAVVAAKIEESRSLSASDDQFDLAPDHSAEK